MAALAAVCILAFLVRIFHAGDPFGGFHSFNEGWYSTLALNYRTHSLLYPVSITGNIDFNVVPFYSYILYAAESVFGDREIVYRTVSIIANVMTLPFLYLIGRRFLNRRAGLAAAAFYAFAPVSIIVGRNVQTDPVYLFFLFISLHLYLKASDEKSPRIMFWAGLLFGISFFTKQFALLLLPALGIWELIRGRGFRTLDRGHIFFAAGAAAVPGPFFAFHIITRAGQLVKSQSELSAGQLHALNIYDFNQIFNEIYWGLSPLLFIIFFAAAIMFLFRTKNRGASLMLLCIGVFLVFFSFYHGHSYYQMFTTPFICLLCGLALGSLKQRIFTAILVTVVCAAALVQSAALLCAFKYGFNEFETIGKLLGGGKGFTVIVDDDIAASYLPPIHYYCPDADIQEEHDFIKTRMKNGAVTLPRGKTVLISFLSRKPEQIPPKSYIIKRDGYTLVLFGRQVRPYPAGEHYFTINRLELERTASRTDTGLRFAGRPDSMLLSLPEEGKTYRVTDRRMDFNRPAGAR